MKINWIKKKIQDRLSPKTIEFENYDVWLSA